MQMTATVSDIAVRIRQFPKPLFSCAALTAIGDTLMVATIAPAALQSSITVALHDGPVANGRHSGKRSIFYVRMLDGVCSASFVVL
jgi:hypothetical protein